MKLAVVPASLGCFPDSWAPRLGGAHTLQWRKKVGFASMNNCRIVVIHSVLDSVTCLIICDTNAKPGDVHDVSGQFCDRLCVMCLVHTL